MQKSSWFSFKNIFFIIIALSFLPNLLKVCKHYYRNKLIPHTKVGCLTITALADSSFYLKHLNKFLQDAEIKALLLKIKSPGGLPGTAQSLFKEIMKFGEKKPVIAYIEDIGASAAYYVALGAQTIIANPSALVGSIGARMLEGNIGKFLKAHNIELGEVSSGKYKTTTSFLREKTSQELQYLQTLSDDIYHQFVRDVAERRKLSSHSSDWADGKIFTGNQALKLKLIDKVGTFSDVKEELINAIIERNQKITGEIKLIYPQQLHGLAKLLYGNNESEFETSFSSRIATFIVEVFEKVNTHFQTKTPITL